MPFCFANLRQITCLASEFLFDQLDSQTNDGKVVVKFSNYNSVVFYFIFIFFNIGSVHFFSVLQIYHFVLLFSLLMSLHADVG